MKNRSTSMVPYRFTRNLKGNSPHFFILSSCHLVILSFLQLPSLRAEDVPQFRGAGGSGVSAEKGLPTHWGPGANIRWKADLPGKGLSNPAIAGGRVFVTACTGFDQKRLHVLCFDIQDGKKLWERQFWATGTTLCHAKTNMAAPSPATDGKHVFALFATGDLVCLDRDGDLVWYRSLVGDYPTVGNNVGMAASPVLWNDLFIVCLENAGESFAAGIDKATGHNRWKIDRPRGINWVTPLVVPATASGEAEVIFQGGGTLSAHDPATGKLRWSLSGHRLSGYSSPTLNKGTIFAAGEKFLAVKPARGKQEPDLLWLSSKMPVGYSSPLVEGDRVYALTARGVLNCADAANGQQLWTLRVEGTFAASPMLADGKLYLVSEEGNTTVVQTGPEPKILAVNSLEDTFLACPVASGGALFLRSDKHLYCIAEKK